MESTRTPPTDPPDGPPAPQPPAGGSYGPYPGPPPAPQRQGLDGFFDAVRRIGVVRTNQRWIGGVAGGIARRFGIDPLLVRGILAASALLGGLGLVVYGLGWALLPEESDGRIHLQETIRGRFDIALLGAIGLFLMGLNSGSGVFWWFGWDGSYGWIHSILWVAAIVAIVAIVVAANGQRHRPEVPPMSRPSTPPPPAPYSPAQPAPAQTAPAPASPGATFASSTGYGPSTSGSWARAGAYGPYGAGSSTGYVPPAPYVQAAPYVAPRPPRPPRPHRPGARGAGPAATGIVLALGLLSLAWLMLSRRAGVFDGPVMLTATGITIVLAGIGIMVAGLLGRRSGGLGAVAILAVLLAGPLTWSNTDKVPWYSTWVAFGQETYRPTDTAQATGGYSVVAGDMRVDLTALPLDPAHPITVPVSVGAGDVVVVIPDKVPITATTRTLAGQVDWNVDGSTSSVSGAGVGRSRTWQNEEAQAGQTVEIILDIQVNAGQITIEEN